MSDAPHAQRPAGVRHDVVRCRAAGLSTTSTPSMSGCGSGRRARPGALDGGGGAGEQARLVAGRRPLRACSRTRCDGRPRRTPRRPRGRRRAPSTAGSPAPCRPAPGAGSPPRRRGRPAAGSPPPPGRPAGSRSPAAVLRRCAGRRRGRPPPGASRSAAGPSAGACRASCSGRSRPPGPRWSTPQAATFRQVSNVRAVMLACRNEPVSVRMPAYSAAPTSGVSATPSAATRSCTISAHAAALGSNQLSAPYIVFPAW